VLTGGAGGRAMSLAFEEIFSIADAFLGIPMAGRTDAWILADAAAAHGIPRDSPGLAQFPEVYVRHLAMEILNKGPRYGIMPGIPALLAALDVFVDRDDAYLALLTGNYEAGARLKLEHFDLWRYFPCGAFGDGAADRNGLVPKALARVAASGGPVFAASDAIVIGDTPLDVACAKAGGARSIAVATGNHTIEELRTAGADAVFEDLSDTQAVLTKIWPR
jgi:phosphoglycolate phosphatase-like HAD superfamily hydrolase